MCVEDYRLGRFITPVSVTLALAIGGSKVFPANRQRVALWVATVVNDADFLDTTKVVFTGGHALAWTFSHPDLMLNIKDHGLLVQQGFTVSAPTEAHSIGVTEFILPESMLAVDPKHWQTKYGIMLGI